MYEIILKFCVGVVLLLFSTQKLVKLAEKLSKIFRISPLIVGITVVAIGTSLPELIVSLISIIKHDAGLAMGNIIGSNIVNVLMVFPVGLLIGKLKIGTIKTQQNALILLMATAIFFATQFTKTVKVVSGIFLVGLAILVSVVEYRLAIFGRTHEDIKRFRTTKNSKMGINILFIGILLMLGIIGGGVLVVDSVEQISLLTGISTTILGLTLTAIATSLPELLTTVFSQEDNESKITVGNILGSNIYNLLLVGGIIYIFPSTIIFQTKEWIWLTVTTLGFVFILKYYKGQSPPRIIGIILLPLFVYYLFSQ